MFTFRASAEVTENRRIELTVPKEVPVGHAEFVVTLATPVDDSSKPARTSLADWAAEQAENWGYRVETVTEALIEKAIALYAGRSDKEWGLTDCVSFVLMEQEGVVEAVTADIHFQQAGYRALLLESER